MIKSDSSTTTSANTSTTTTTTTSTIGGQQQLHPLSHWTVPKQQQSPFLSIYPPPLSSFSSVASSNPSTMMMMTPQALQQLPLQHQQLTGILYPHPHDVLCGRGGQSNVHPGNTQWRTLVATNKELYVTLPKKQKMLLAQSIVHAVRSQNPPGRFIQKDLHHDVWYDVGDKRAQEKTSQALREGAPEIRIKIGSTGATSSSDQNSTTTSPKTVRATTIISPVSSLEIPMAKKSKTSNSDVIPDPKTETKEKTELSSEEITEETEMIVPPEPSLGPTTSKEQMPPPSTIPPSVTTAQNSGVRRKLDKELSVTTKVTKVTTMVEKHPHVDETQILPPPPLAPPAFSNEAHNGCSFGSMGLLSDIDQARLMQSLRTPSYGNNNDLCTHHQYDARNGPYGTSYNRNATINNNTQQQQQYQSSASQLYDQYPSVGMNGYDSMPQQYIQQQPQPRQGGQFYQNDDGGNYMPTQYHAQHPPAPLIHDVRIPLPVDGGLDPGNAFSIGSLMSVGTCTKLEDAGFSFGSAMSCTPIPINTTDRAPLGNEKQHPLSSSSVQPPDGGLEDVGTSFGSMSIADGERERIISDAERDMKRLNDFMNQTDHSLNLGANHSDSTIVPTTFLQQQKSRGSLLACDDEDDENTTSAEVRSQKGAQEWNKLQATLAMEDPGIRDAISVPPTFVTNPTSYYHQQQSNGLSSYNPTNLNTPTFDRDYSQMSAISVGEDFAAPPMPRMAVTTSRYDSSSSAYYSNNDNFNYSNNPVSTESIVNDPNWDQYESAINQEAIMPPKLKKSCTNRY